MELSFYTNFASDLAQQEAQLSTLQQQVATGTAVQSPDQNPTEYETATLGTDQINQLNGEASAQENIQSQLGSVNDVYQSYGSLLDHLQSVVEQALNATTSTANMQALSSQVSSSLQQLVGLGNSTGTNGEYLFGGTRGSIPPFQTGASGSIVYMGDGGQSQAAISPTSSAATLANGDAFMNGLAGNGYASVTAGTGNSGTATLVSEGVANPAAASSFQAGASPITLSFAQGASGLTYTATQAGNTVATGAVTSTTTLQLAGLDYQLNGTPAAGDSFTLSPSRPQSAFTLVQNIVNTLAAAGSSSANSAQITQQLNEELSGLGQYQQAVLTAQAQTGVTLQAVSTAATNDTTQQTALQSQVQSAIGVNMPAAITELDQNLTAVQAAMKAFSSVQSLSLFNYI